MTATLRLAAAAAAGAAGAPRVSVIVPVAAPPDLLAACLRSLARHPPAVAWEVILVLHGPAAAREAEVRAAVAGVELVTTPVQLGLAGAANRARQQARGEYLVLLHDDAEVEAGWLDALVRSADDHPEAGIVGSKVLEISGELQAAGAILWRNAATSPPWVGAAPPSDAFDRPLYVDYCGTTSLLVRAATWDAVGGCEERFHPAYFVDVDLAMATRRLGQAVLLEPRSVVRHHRGASTDRPFRSFVKARNRRLFVEKWHSQLADHEPAAPDSTAAVERALARAAAAARTPGRVPPAAPARAPFDPALQERRHLALAADLYAAYAAHLAAELARTWPSPPSLPPTVQVDPAELNELRRRSQTLTAIESGRLWRLYTRLLPLLRALNRRSTAS